MIDLYIQEVGEIWCGAALEKDKVFATSFGFDKKAASQSLLYELPFNTIFQAAEESSPLAKEALKTIGAVWKGEDVSFSFEFNMSRLSNYAQKVLRLTSLVPTGYVTTYGALAKAAGGGPRSVGRVMATNPFAPLVPCHRVVAFDMTLGGYGVGLRMKWGILQRENRNYNKAFEAKMEGKPLRLFPISMLKPP